MDLDLGGYPLDPYNEVVVGLAQGSSAVDPPELFALGFDAIWDVRDNARHASTDRYHFHPLSDVPWLSPEDAGAVDTLAAEVAGAVRRGQKVICTCMSGLNHSGLLVARALIELGHAPLRAIELVRAARGPRALSNRAFVRWLFIDCAPRGIAGR